MREVSIVICSRKGGHKFPAEAITHYLRSHYANEINAKFVNFLDHIPIAGVFDSIGRWGDLKLPVIWKGGYSSLTKGYTLYSSLFKKGMAIALANTSAQRKIKTALGKTDLILSLQPEVNCIAGYLKEWFGVPVQAMVMDYSSHVGWADENISQYYVVNSFVYDQLIEYGIPKERIQITGAPSQRGFEEVTKNSVKVQRQKLGLKENLPTILIMAGYLGKMVDYVGIVNTLLKSNISLQLLMVFGRNRVMYEKFTKEFRNENIHLYYNIPSIHTVMWAADLIISKPGGMVIADSLTLGKPMMLIDPKAGSLQEIIFADYIEKQGVGIHLKNASDVKNRVKDLFSYPEKLNKLAEESKKLGIKNRTAAKTIAENIKKTLNLHN
jgi:processive 1,2-diacylglycerol beta-glucosyltransferase